MNDGAIDLAYIPSDPKALNNFIEFIEFSLICFENT